MADVWNFLRDPQARSEMRNALTDSANRGMVAGSLGAPVDLATTLTNLLIAGGGYVGHKTGLLSQPPDLIDSRNVPGSSEWIGQKMQKAGAVSPNRNALAEFGMGLLSPVAYKGAQKVGGLLYNAETNALANAAKPSTMVMKGQRGVAMVGSPEEKKLMYHVAPEGHSGNLLSLYKQYGDDAYQMYAGRWPESGNLAQDHAHYVHLHDNLKDAKAFAAQRGGKIYSIDPSMLADDWIDVINDRLEYPHPMVRDEIPAEYLREIK